MMHKVLRRGRFSIYCGVILGLTAILTTVTTVRAQSTAEIRGTVVDPQGNSVPNASVIVRNQSTGVQNTTETDTSGIFVFPTLPPGSYRLEITHEGFQKLVVEAVALSVNTITTEQYRMQIGNVTTEVSVTSTAAGLDQATTTVGQVIDRRTVQEIPLNGRHFVDLSLLSAGTVTPPQNGFLTAPLRGQGSFAVNTAGNREDTTNWMVNGINLNDMANDQITFQPSINTVSEFKVDNQTFSAEYGRNSGSIVNIATRSGTSEFHGEAFDFVRNQDFDARNFFNFATSSTGASLPQSPFKRNNFGASLGGPVIKDRMFFFLSYEGLRQRQGITLASCVLTSAEQAQAAASGSQPVIALSKLVPAAVSFSGGCNPPGSTNTLANQFLGSATAPVNLDQGTGDVDTILGTNDRLHGYYAIQEDIRREPTLQGNTIPNFGDTRQSRRQIMTLDEAHTFSAAVVNDVRLGFNRIHIIFTPNHETNPSSIGIQDTVNAPIGLPQITIQSLALNFGGPSGFPQGRGDTTVVLNDTLSWLHGRHTFKFGAEGRRVYNNNIALDTGTLQFLDVAHFLNGQANRFTMTEGNASDKILVAAAGGFLMDTFQWRPNLTLELGFRWDYNGTPTEANNRFTAFLPSNGTLMQTGANGLSMIYPNNFKNFQPRLGFAWDPFQNAKTVVRGAYAILSDQPEVIDLTGNPPFATPVVVNSAASGITFANIPSFSASSLAPTTVNQNYRDAYVQDWNLNIEHEWSQSLTTMIGYFGSKGTHLRDPININQAGGGGAQVLKAVSSSSPIDPGVPLTTIVENDSNGFSTYNALWVTATKRLTHGLELNTSYTYSHSIDSNSLAGTIVTQDFTNLALSKGSSDFDARHRFVLSGLYQLPFHGNRWVEGWEIADITQWQSGNPLNLVTTNTSFNGFQTIRPDLTGSISYVRTVANWFGTGVFAFPGAGTTVTHFGDLGRNVIDGPTFSNTDFSLQKTTNLTERVRLQFRSDFFDIFNHPNFGQPGRVLNTSTFGVITSTRFPTGDFGSARQIQLALKLLF